MYMMTNITLYIMYCMQVQKLIKCNEGKKKNTQ